MKLKLIILLMISILFISACGKTESTVNSGTDGNTSEIKIGVSVPMEANNSVKTWYKAIQARADVYGFEVMGIDAQGDASKQSSDINTLLGQDIDALIVWPLDSKALQPALDRVAQKNIPMFGIDFNVQKGGDDYGMVNQMILGREAAAVTVAKLFADSYTEAEVAGIGFAIPVPGNIFVMDKYKSELKNYDHLTFAGQQDNPSDNIAGAEPLMKNLLTANPNIKAVFAYNDESAIGASQAISNAGGKLYSEDKKDGIMVVGFNAEKGGIQAVKNGKMHATFNINPVKSGAIQVDFINQYVVEKAQDSIAKEIIVPSPLIDPSNVKDFVSWEEELKLVKDRQYDALKESGAK
ncbi:sugar ABC transporter substrate-binding protein [Niallia endozanthoxylica]|uniref:Substrate-binding domain-containing protein n=1 Tax=Niallia endozanthoxylica TaxID=2036016 RepID=A0A5J5HX69_9BACI|nr:sugar ABC transporter substrate-binding protein [Niallia endozanthoxylica]KAA9026988.1 substrate-binding domain-containing protein [Niallia endozanthoxylica]